MEVGELEGVKGKDKEKAALHGLPIRELTFQSRALTSLRVRGVHSPGDVFVRRELERRAKWLAKEAVKKEIVEDRMEEATAQGRAGDVKMEDALEGDGGDKPISDGGAVEGEAETSKPDAAIEKDEVQGQGGVAKLEVKAEVHEGAEPLTSEKAKEDGARMSEDTKPLATATPALPPPVRKPFNGARVMVLHQDGQWYGGFLSFLNDDDEGKWHVIFEDNEEDDLFVNSGECTVVSVKEAAPADGVCLAHGILRIKRDMLDMCAALPTQDTLWWARRKHVWEADVRNARSVSQLNVLLHEFGRCVKSDLREKWWCPWDGFEVPQAGAQQVTSVRCRYTEGGSSWRCKSAAIPGKSVCKRHLKKQLASAGVAGFKVIMRPSDNPEGLKNVKLEEGMDVEVFYPRDNEWYQAKVMSVNKKGAPKVAYINAGDEGQVTNTSTTEVVTDKKRLRLPEKAEGEGEKEGHSKEDEDGEEDEDEHGEEEKGLIMANEEVVTSASVLLRIHSLDQALRYADEIHHDPPPKKTPAKRGRKKK
uniref:WRC domain-containing protein n=1 Tax=Hemiselmis tepida TaxID=464990 RepID=A0A7S0W4I1_9CRYP